MSHQVQVGKGGAKIGSIDIGLSGALGEEQTVAPRTKDIHGVISRQVRQADRQHGLPLAKYMRTPAKSGSSIFLIHCMHSTVGDDVPGIMRTKKYETIFNYSTTTAQAMRKLTVRGSIHTASPANMQQVSSISILENTQSLMFQVIGTYCC